MDACPRGATQFRTLSSLAEMEAIADAWKALERRCAVGLTYFQSYSWCQNWVATFCGDDRGHRMRIETAWQGAALVAVWPLMTVSAGGLRIVRNLGEPHSQYCGLLCDPDRFGDGEAKWLLARVIGRQDCDVAVFEALPERSPLTPLLRGRAKVSGYANSSCLLDLSSFDSANHYAAQLGQGRQRRRVRRRRRLERLGTLDFRVIWPDDPQFAELVRLCVAMKRKWLTETGRFSAGFSMAGLDSFLAGLDGDGEAREGACLSVLKAGEQIVALELGFIQDRHYYSYLGSFDWELRDLSPGKVQMELTVGWLIDNRAATYDLLGNPADYKQSWSNRAITLDAFVLPFTWKGHIYAQVWLAVLRPAAKRMLNVLPDIVRRIALGGQSAGLLVLHV